MDTATSYASGPSSFLAQYIPLVDFLGQSMGPNVEIVLHDLDIPDKSIIAISNSHISGRQIGGPVTDFALWFMKQGDATHVPMMTGYRAVNSEGRVCRSSSYFLRDEHQVMRGMLCINVDVSDLIQMRNLTSKMIGNTETTAQEKSQAFGGYPGPGAIPPQQRADESSGSFFPQDIQTFIQQPSVAQISSELADEKIFDEVRLEDSDTDFSDSPEGEEEVVESLGSNIQHLLESMLDKTIAEQGVSPERMQREERVEAVRGLEDAGFFLLKGGIAAAAKRLEVSEPTIYRYLVEVRS